MLDLLCKSCTQSLYLIARFHCVSRAITQVSIKNKDEQSGPPGPLKACTLTHHHASHCFLRNFMKFARLTVTDRQARLLAVERVPVGLFQGGLKRERVAAVAPWLTFHARRVVRLPGFL